MIKFITSNYDNEIKEIEVTRETDKCYFVPAYRTGKEDRRNKDRNCHNTWNDAHSYLFDRTKQRLESLESQLNKAKADLQTIIDLTN